ncbi:MAG: hypothetical protein ABFD60_15045, partial [Bryobacteraceae bacterium]
ANAALGSAPGTAGSGPAPHSLLTDDPGKPVLDLWGWHASPFYQRRGGRVVSPEYLKKRAVEESYKWGANLIEIYRGGYPLEQRAGWTRESTAEFHRYIHDLDMLVQWFPHRLDRDTAPNANLISHWAKGSDDQSNTFTGAVEAMRDLARTLFDSLDVPPDELLDVFGSEQWPLMHADLFNKCMWPYNPAMSFYTDNHAFDETLPNEIDVTASNGFGVDDQTSGYHKLPSEIRKQYGFQFWGSQAECRNGIAENRFGGLGQPDWILKQVNDQFRERARASGNRRLSPSAVWWINEAEEMCSGENRRYVYGTSQDPVKCAVTATLASCGQDGIKVETESGTRGLSPRYPYPGKTAFIENNYLCVFASPGQDRLTLWRDPERLGHFDNDSPATLLCDPLARTVIAGSERAPVVKSVNFEYVEPAGYKAVWRSRLQMECEGCHVEETRTCVVLNDTPYVSLRVERTVSGGKIALGARFGLPHYDSLTLDAAEHDHPVDAPVCERLTLKDKSGRYPDLVFLLRARGRLASVKWTPKRSLTFESLAHEQESFEVAVLIPERLYNSRGIDELIRHLMEPEEAVTLDDAGQAIVTNKSAVPLVKVVRVSGAGPHPYQLFEFGRWVFRGAQPSLAHKGEDYLKCYLPAHGSIKIQRYGFLEAVARPGWGCQYTMALGECWRRGRRAGTLAEVREVTSFLFAPRIRFRNRISEVWLDGNPWRYFDGHHVFLPNRRGRYRVEVIEDECNDPVIARTFAHIEKSVWQKECLSFEARLPEWVNGIPEDFDFVALIRHPGRELAALDHARLLRSKPSVASMVSFKPGTVSLSFAPAGGAAIVQANPIDEIEDHLNRRSATMLTPYLSSFGSERVSIATVASDPATLRRYDVLVWNHYCLDSLPRGLTPDVVEALRNYVSRGGGLFLIANAVRLLPQLTGASATAMKTLHIGHHLNSACESFGLEIVSEEHPVFRGLRQSGDRCVPLISPRTFDIFKRVLPADAGLAATAGNVLAKMHVECKPGESCTDPIFEPSPIMWEWRIGKGTVIGLGCGLRYTLGSPNRWTPSENAVSMARNIVRYLGHGQEGIKVGILP